MLYGLFCFNTLSLKRYYLFFLQIYTIELEKKHIRFETGPLPLGYTGNTPGGSKPFWKTTWNTLFNCVEQYYLHFLNKLKKALSTHPDTGYIDWSTTILLFESR